MSSASLAIHRLEPQSARGRARLAKILDAATELFLKVGYEQASIDAILVQSGGSKSTLYAYFPTKQDLFRSVIDNVVDNSDVGAALDISANARVVLTEFAVSRQRVVLSPRHRAVLGLVIAERDRFPDLAADLLGARTAKSQRQLTTYLEALKHREILGVDDAEEAAEFFIGMLFQHWHKQLFYVNLPPPSEAVMRARAERVVARFWRRIGAARTSERAVRAVRRACGRAREPSRALGVELRDLGAAQPRQTQPHVESGLGLQIAEVPVAFGKLREQRGVERRACVPGSTGSRRSFS